MRKEALKRLIEKYYEGQTTPEEEKELRTWFAENEVPEEYEAEKAIFAYYDEVGEIPGPAAGFEERIIAALDSPTVSTRRSAFRRFLVPAMSAAAGLLILLSVYLTLSSKKEKDTYSDPQLAYAETMKILRDVSSKMNRGTSAMSPVARINEVKTRSLGTINRSSAVVSKNLRTLGYLNSDERNNPSDKQEN